MVHTTVPVFLHIYGSVVHHFHPVFGIIATYKNGPFVMEAPQSNKVVGCLGYIKLKAKMKVNTVGDWNTKELGTIVEVGSGIKAVSRP
jgi:hypothetical protein